MEIFGISAGWVLFFALIIIFIGFSIREDIRRYYEIRILRSLLTKPEGMSIDELILASKGSLKEKPINSTLDRMITSGSVSYCKNPDIPKSTSEVIIFKITSEGRWLLPKLEYIDYAASW